MTGKASEPAAGFQNRFRSVPRTGWPFARQAPDASNRLRPAVPTCYDRRRHLGGSPCPAWGGGSSSACLARRSRGRSRGGRSRRCRWSGFSARPFCCGALGKLWSTAAMRPFAA